jgi:predicted RNA-binding protein with PIN domain
VLKIIYIDAYNVLRKIVPLSKLLKSDADAARRRFVDFLATREDVRKCSSTTVVFDGHGEAISAVPWIRIVFTNTRTADSWINMKIEAEKNTRNVLVITSDHEIQNHVSAFGASVLRSEDFIQSTQPSRQHRSENNDESYKEQPISSKEIQFWLSEFNSKKS